MPRADMTLIQSVPTEIRQLNVNTFRLILRDLEDDVLGRPWPKTHTHNTIVVVGGVPLARVVEILDPYTITFEDGQYAVNLTGANSNVADKTNVNQVSVRSANSAGLVDLEILIASAYQGHVVVSPTFGQAGTDEPIGTFGTPSNNLNDALTIALKQGVRQFTFLENMTLTQDFSLGYTFKGISPFVTITIAPIADVTGCSLTLLTVEGEMDGLNTVRECSIKIVTNVSGFFELCSFTASVTLIGKMDCYNCFSQVEGSGFPTFTVGPHPLVMRNHKGSAGMLGAVAGHVSSIGVNEGRVVVDNSNVGGDIHVRGKPFRIDDTSGPLCTVFDETSGLTADQDITLGLLKYVEQGVYVNTELGQNGDGAVRSPYNNWTDAVDFAESASLFDLFLLADATVDRQLKNFIIKGVGLPTIDLNGHIMDNTIIERAAITGSYSGAIQGVECVLLNLSNASGVFLGAGIIGALTVAANSNLIISNVGPGVAGQPYTVNMNGGVASQAELMTINGDVVVSSMDHAGDVLHLHFSSGSLLIDASCTDGSLVLSGDVHITNLSSLAGIDVSAVTSELVWDEEL